MSSAEPGDPFVGRKQDIDFLSRVLRRVRREGRGAMISMRGRRRVGKSRLAEEFIRRSDCRSVFYTAVQGPGPHELERFMEALAASDAPAAEAVRSGATARTWEAALALAVQGGTRQAPIVLVIDELPYLAAKGPTIEAVLQLVWDRTFQRQPVVVLLIGSDRTTMEALSEEGRPLYDRARAMVVKPLDPSTIGEMLGLPAAEALDAYTVIGGFPVLALEWGRGRSLFEYLADALTDASSFLVISAELALAAEFPADLQARSVLYAIGSGARAHKALQARAGLHQSALDRAIKSLLGKGVVQRTTPYSAVAAPKTREYHVADPYMRFWLRFIGPATDLVDRGRGERVVDDIAAGWGAFRGCAIEPTVRDALERMLPQARFGKASYVGSYWNRTHTVEVDLVGGDRRPTAASIAFVGSVKWRDEQRFGRGDTAALIAQRTAVPGAEMTTKLVGVSRNGFDEDAGLDVALSAEDILSAYRSPKSSRY